MDKKNQYALSGKDMIVSGFKNKMQVAMSDILPDKTVADRVKTEQSPVGQKPD